MKASILFSLLYIATLAYTPTGRENDYKKEKELGKGGTAVVYLATQKSSGTKVVIKEPLPDIPPEERDVVAFAWAQENYLLTTKLKGCPNIIEVLDEYYVNNNMQVVILEYAVGGELLHLVQSKFGNVLTPELMKKMFLGMTMGVEQAHERGVCHRDIKPENFLVFQDVTKTINPQQPLVKLADFGTALEEVDTYTPLGTLLYFSPELILAMKRAGMEKRDYLTGVNCYWNDVWALGATFYRLALGSDPFDRGTNEDTIKAILNDKLWFPPGFDRNLELLLMWMMNKDPQARMKLRDVRKQPWFYTP